jgi:hypothetical protein
MKLTGKGSVSLFLRRLLDVVWYILLVAIGGVLVAVFVFAFLPFPTGPGVENEVSIQADFLEITFDNPAANDQHLINAALLGTAVIELCVAQLIVGRLRRLFRSLESGKIFTMESAGHVRWIGIFCICGAVFGAIYGLVVGSFLAGAISIPGVELNVHPAAPMNGIFLGLVILVLSEVFRSAARLQEDHDLTV